MSVRSILVAIIAVSVIGVTALSVFRGSEVETASQYVKRAERDAKRVYSTIATVQFSLGKDTIRERLALSSLNNEAEINEPRLAALLDAASEFLWMRFGQLSPVEYRAWRNAQGREWVPLEFLEEWWTISEQYRQLLGQNAKAAAGLTEMFDALWHVKHDLDSGFHQPVAFADEERGLAILIGQVTATNPSRSMVSGELTSSQWYGGRSSSDCPWWATPHTKEDLLIKVGQTEYAEIGLIVECGDGSRRSMFLTYFWDPIVEEWILHYLNTNNENSATLMAIDF